MKAKNLVVSVLLWSVPIWIALGWGRQMFVIVNAAAFVPSARPLCTWKSTILPIQQEVPTILPQKHLLAFSTTNSGEDDEDDEEEGGESSPSRLRRKRDMIKDWISSTKSGGKSMVRPIRMEDGSIVEDTSQPRFKANFGDLFAGMPSMDDILAGEDDDAEASNDNTQNHISAAGSKKKGQQDESWFEEERKQIEANYDAIYKEMVAQLQEQRQQNPEGVPANAEAMVKDVLRQEMKTEIAKTKETMAKQRLTDYEDEKKKSFEAQDMSEASSEVVDSLMKEDQAAQAMLDAAQARLDEYRRYELEAFLRKPNQDVPEPGANSNLDQWALDRLQAMVDTRQGGGDDDFIVTDILEDSVEDLRERIEKEAGRSSIKPETMKEWQMYRAIATRLGAQTGLEKPTKLDEASEEQIAAQLQSWKDFLVKEDTIRKQSGLSRGPKLPFEWQESGRDKEIEDARIQAALKSRGEMSKNDIRKEVNRKSIEALEKLVMTSDPIRSARLKKDLDTLKEELESSDYLDFDESAMEEEEEVLGPVDVSDVFRSSREKPIPAQRPTPLRRDEWQPGTLDDSFSSSTSPPIPPDTAFFSSETSSETKPPPPSTPFFSSQDDEVDDVIETPSDDASGGTSQYRLGTIAEQKLRAMYQRAGARTDEEKAAIRAQWEEFEKFEQSKRDQSGLSDGDDSVMLSQAAIKYNFSDIAKEDGDFDAEKILSTIGPRPTRKRKADGRPEGSSAGPASTTPAKDDESIPQSSLDPAEVSESLYRAVSAVGGGRTRDDPEAKAKEKASFAEFMEKENELRQSLDNLDEEVSNEVSKLDDDFDDEEYAEDALASIGPRPAPKRRKISETEYSDKGIALSDDDDDEEDAYDSPPAERSQMIEKGETESTGTRSSGDDLIPGWLRKERESALSREGSSSRRGGFLGSDIDDVFDDDDYEHNMRQLAEYERRRAGGRKQMGIDISDVLGRSSDDYADYTFDDNYFRGKKSGWGASGFEARKANLMEYTELDVMEVNNLMDHKDSVYSTGVSQYLPRINKPFKEFGAIFRLEGVLVDTTGFHYEAWKRVASEKGFKAPTIEDVRRASVMRADLAVRAAFFWTDDIILCREAAAAHRRALNDVFNEWMDESSISPPTGAVEDNDINKGALAIGEEVVRRKPSMDPLINIAEGEKIKLLADAWSRTAVMHRLAAPTREQVEMASVLNPEIAVRKAFQWSMDASEVDKYVASYRGILRELSGTKEEVPESKTPQMIPPARKPESVPGRPLDQNAIMEIQFQAWTKIAEDNGFELPLPEEVMAAVVINDPEIAIRDGFGWTEDISRIPQLVASYRETFARMVDEARGGGSSPAEAVSVGSQVAQIPSQETRDTSGPTGPTPDEMLEMQRYAWKSAALNRGFQVPPDDQILLAMKMFPTEAITRLFDWTTDETMIQALFSTYNSALKDISQKYIRKYNLSSDVVLFPQQVAAAQVRRDDTNGGSSEVYQAAFDAWSAVARKNGLKMPDEDEILFALSVGPEEAVISGFEWASPRDDAEVSRIVEAYKEELKSFRSKWGGSEDGVRTPVAEASEENIPMFSVVPGAEKWVRSLLDVEMQCAVVSFMNREQVDVLLDVAGLSHLFSHDKRVTASNNYGRDVDQLLGAALRLERRPDHCVAFDASPYAAGAAHDVEMRSVSVIGPFPRYDLLSADSTAGSFEELTAMNVRRLFGERVHDQPMVDMQQADPEKRGKTRTKYFWDDD
jgi:beta-phosphoglucomutase-like phosphatase (HAD superfamily)